MGNKSTNVDDAVPLGKKVQFSDLVGGQCLLQMIKINETFLSLERPSIMLHYNTMMLFRNGKRACV